VVRFTLRWRDADRDAAVRRRAEALDARVIFFARVVFLLVLRAVGRFAWDIPRFGCDIRGFALGFRAFLAGAGSGGCAETNECLVASHGGTPSLMPPAC